MKRHLVEGYPALLQARDQRIGEMQPGRGCGHRTFGVCEYGLIIQPITLVRLPSRCNVRRQRHGAAFAHRLIEDGSVERKSKHDLAPRLLFLDLRIELAEKAD